MNRKHRNILLAVLFVVILMVIFGFSQLWWYIPYGEGKPSPLSFTRAYIETQNHIVETLISQTQTATAQALVGTFTPVPPS